jgi:hypothetical protein
MQRAFRAGDPVIYVVSKNGTHPGPRAKHLHPAPAGETYSYQVEKFWTVAEVRLDGHLLLVTRRGKQHDVESTDPRLRPARWWERWIYRERFPALNPAPHLVNSGTSD